jgi:hypothetical protein
MTISELVIVPPLEAICIPTMGLAGATGMPPDTCWPLMASDNAELKPQAGLEAFAVMNYIPRMLS